jgi:hypothetical protein
VHQVGNKTKFIRLVHFFPWNRVMELYLKRLLTFEDTFYVGKDVIPYCVYESNQQDATVQVNLLFSPILRST